MTTKLEKTEIKNKNLTKMENLSGELEEDFQFSNLTFAIQEQKKETKRDKRNKFKGRDYKRLLAKATKRNEQLARIRDNNPQKAETVVNNIAWERALRRAAGQKVKDNIGLLKKGLQRKQKTKTKRKQKWAERKEAVEQRMEKRQQQRQKNITKRRAQTKKKKGNGR